MRYAVIVLALLILVVGGVVPPAAANVGPDTAAGLDTPLAQMGQIDGNESAQTTIVVDVDSDTNATWEIRTRHTLQSPADVRAFEQLVEELRRGEANQSLDEEMFRNYAELAEESTGREMAVTDVQYTGTVTDDNSTGVLTMSFTWTNFAQRTENNGLRVGDAFTTVDGGTWFPWLAEDQRLVIETPPNYDVRNSFQASTRGDSLVTDGPRSFRDDPIYVVYEFTGESTVEEPWPDVPPALVAGVGAMLVLVVAGVWYLRQQEETIPQSDVGPAQGAMVDQPSAEPEEPAEEADDVDLSLLSDEERVEHLLEQRGGRMRQADIVKETGWSDAKVSQLLSAMADEGRVDKLRIGRENLISLPDKGFDSDDET